MRRFALLLIGSATWFQAGCDAVTTDLAEEQELPEGRAVVLAAGDIADCDSHGDEATSRLLDRLGGTILVLGDVAYPSGSAGQFASCYEPTWGRHRDRTRPVPGNHEYRTPDARAYFEYFGDAAAPERAGYYSFEAGPWHVIALNTEIGIDAGSAQAEWLRADLAAHPTPCTLAFMHRPRFSSGEHGNSEDVEHLWQILHEGGADLVLAGHDHHYERLAPLLPGGTPDPGGMRSFVVGTGGKSLRRAGPPEVGSEQIVTGRYGVLRLALHDTGYDWSFLDVNGHARDSGTALCR